MTSLIDLNPIDRETFDAHLRDWLPERLIDVHAHVWLDRFKARQSSAPQRAVTWPARVALDNSIGDLLETYRLLLPGRRVTPLFFGNVAPGDDPEAANAYVSQCARERRLPALIFAAPHWSGYELERRIRAGGFLGAKVYLTLSDPRIPAREIRIYDYLPPAQLEALNRNGWIVMLHIPRDGRLRDPLNLAHMREIERRYPRVKVIIAHVGRAYCDEDVGDAFEALADTRRMLFDFSANTNAGVFEKLIRAVGPKRILFGTDMPILRMRMRRICEGGRYVNLVPRGLYGDVSGDPNMREIDGPEAERLTFFLYEELLAFRRAAEAAGLTSADLEDIFHNNAAGLLRGVGYSTMSTST
jgi:predicted TIM-barrel fold metal-dependent hydrolase